MTCYTPLLRIEDRTSYMTAKDGHKYHPARIEKAENLEEFRRSIKSYGQKEIAQIISCGNCIGCRIDKSRDWANRGYLESLYWKNNWFVTLTYDQDHLPVPEEITTSEGITYTELEPEQWKGTLVKKELTQFMKNLRQIMKREYNQEGIRFMACGEYGGEGERPHYHVILFNCNLPAETFYNPHLNWQKDYSYKNEIIERAWGGKARLTPEEQIQGKKSSCKGICDISEATWENIAYTARYITKKLNGRGSEEYYAEKGQIPEIYRVSNQPGIGYQYYRDHKDEIYKNDQILIQNKKGSHWIKPPSYYDMLYERENPQEFEKIKKKRQERMLNEFLRKDETTSLTRYEQLQVERRTKEAAVSTLKRNLEREMK